MLVAFTLFGCGRDGGYPPPPARWEFGTVGSDQETMQFVFGALNQMPFLDSALQGLVHTSSLQVHLITDVDQYADTERSSVLLSCSA